MKSDLERIVETHMIQVGLPHPETEYKFHPTRKWRFDIAFPSVKVAVEIEGGIYGGRVYCQNCGSLVKQQVKSGAMVEVRVGGRHSRGSSFEKDAEKYNEAAILGWLVIRLTESMIKSGTGVEFIERAVAARSQNGDKDGQ